MIYVNPHAIERFIERVKPVSPAEAKAEILSHSNAIEVAAKFGAEIIKLGDGSRLVVDGLIVITAYGKGMLPRQCRHGGPE